MAGGQGKKNLPLEVVAAHIDSSSEWTELPICHRTTPIFEIFLMMAFFITSFSCIDSPRKKDSKHQQTEYLWAHRKLTSIYMSWKCNDGFRISTPAPSGPFGQFGQSGPPCPFGPFVSFQKLAKDKTQNWASRLVKNLTQKLSGLWPIHIQYWMINIVMKRALCVVRLILKYRSRSYKQLSLSMHLTLDIMPFLCARACNK